MTLHQRAALVQTPGMEEGLQRLPTSAPKAPTTRVSVEPEPGPDGSDDTGLGGSMRQVTVNTTVICNFRCTYCAVGTINTLADGGIRNREQDLVDVPGTLRELYADDYRIVIFSGGEPTVQRELPAWLSLARDLGYVQRTMNTNAARLGDRPELAAELVDAGLTHVNVSFHSCVPEVFDEISAMPGVFPRVVRGLDALVAQGDRLHVHVTLLMMKPTVEHVADTIHFVADHGVDKVTLELVRTKGAADTNAGELMCDVDEVARGLAAARRAAAERGVTLNSVDIPSCLLPSADPGAAYDLSSYVIRKRKEGHWVVNKTGAWPINRLTHVHGSRCESCAFLPWCTGFERSLVAEARKGPTTALVDGTPLPPPIKAKDALDRARIAFDSWPREAALVNAREALALLAPAPVDGHTGVRAAGRAANTVAPWLELWGRYGEALLPFDPDDGDAAAAALDVFPPARRVADDRDPTAVLAQLARREALLEKRLAVVREALAALPPIEVPECCARRDQRATALPHFWRHASLRGERARELDTSLLPELAPFVTCRPGCEAARTVARARLDALPAEVRALAERLLSLTVIVLGPWARAVVRGRRRGDTLSIQPGVVLLTDSSRAPASRHALRQAFSNLLFSRLEAGGSIQEREQLLVVSNPAPIQPGEYARRVAWVPLISGAPEDAPPRAT